MPDIDALKRASQAASQYYGNLSQQTNDARQLGAAKQRMMDANDALQRGMLQQQQAPAAPPGPTNSATTPNPAPQQQQQKARGGSVRRQFKW